MSIFLTIIGLFLALYGYLCWHDRKMGLFLLAALLPVYVLRFEVFGVPTTLLEGMILVLAATWILRRPDLNDLLPDDWRWPTTLLLLSATAAIIVAPNTVAALGAWKAYFIEPVLVFAVIQSTLDRADVDRLLQALGVGGLLVATFAIVQFFTDTGIPIPWDVERRVTSVFPFPNAVGLYLGPIITIGVFSLWNAWDQKRIQHRLFWGAVVLAGSAAVYFSQSEAVWVSVPAAVLIFAAAHKRTRIPTLIVASLAGLAVLLIDPIRAKLLLQDYSGQVRVKQWIETMVLLREQPFFGAGLSGYPQALERFHRFEEIEVFQYPHNVLLNIWVELGILGIVAGFLMAKTIIVRLKITLDSARMNWQTIAISGAFLQMCIHGIVDVPYFKNDLAVMVWILIAGFTLVTNAHERHTVETTESK